MLDNINEEKLDKEIQKLQRILKELESDCHRYERQCVDAVLRAGGADHYASRGLFIALERIEATSYTDTCEFYIFRNPSSRTDSGIELTGFFLSIYRL